MKALNAKDIEKLENTSVASSAMAATVGNTTELIACGDDSTCVAVSNCVAASNCLYDSNCHQVSCEVSCDVTDGCNITGCNETQTCGGTCVKNSGTGDDQLVDANPDFVALLKKALA